MADGNSKRADGRNKSGTGSASPSDDKVAQEKGNGGNAGAGTGAPASAGTGAAPGTGAATGAPETGTNNHETIRPADLAADNYERDASGAIVYGADGVTPKKKRGRKRGQRYGAAPDASKPRPARERAVIATEMLAAQFQILNTGIAYLTSFPDFKLDDDEALQMATATANVLEQFDYVPDPKVAAILGLVTTTSMVYGPRMYLYRKHIAKKREEKSERRDAAAQEQPMNNGQFPYPAHLAGAN